MRPRQVNPIRENSSAMRRAHTGISHANGRTGRLSAAAKIHSLYNGNEWGCVWITSLGRFTRIVRMRGRGRAAGQQVCWPWTCTLDGAEGDGEWQVARTRLVGIWRGATHDAANGPAGNESP
jgi:hypothetical protein